MSRILFVGASPGGYWPLNLGREHAGMVASVEAAARGEAVEVIMELQAGRERVAHSLARHRPQVLHFSGHCESEQTEDPVLVLSLDHTDPDHLDGSLLEELLGECSDYVKLVVLNACDSAGLAERIAQVVGCAIGTVGPIRDSDAARFSKTFYRHLADGRSLSFAFNWATKPPSEGDCELKLFDPAGRAKGSYLVPPTDASRGRDENLTGETRAASRDGSIAVGKRAWRAGAIALVVSAGLGATAYWAGGRRKEVVVAPAPEAGTDAVMTAPGSSGPHATEVGKACPGGMVLLMGGEFRPGTARSEGLFEECLEANPGEEKACRNQELRQAVRSEPVTMSPFCLDKTEVARSDFAVWLGGFDLRREKVTCGPEMSTVDFAVAEGRRMMRLAHGVPWHSIPKRSEDEGQGKLGTLPILGVTWDAARQYCTSLGKRLPTEVEWEYAARGPEHHEYVGGRPPACPADGLSGNTAVFGRPVPGATGLPGALCPNVQGPRETEYAGDRSWIGILQLAGNASEWTDTPAEAEGGVSGDSRVVKGGSWQDSAYWTRPSIVAFRQSDCPSPTIGFRCASDALP